MTDILSTAPSYAAEIPAAPQVSFDPGEFAKTQLEKPFHAPYARWKASPDREAAAGMLRAVRPALTAAVRSYAGPDASPVVHSRAKLLALDALQKYDPAQGKLTTFLHRHLQGLRRYAARAGSVIHRPELVRIQQGRLAEAANELRDEAGREPSDLELADRTGLSVARIGHVRSYRPAVSEGRVAASPGEEGGPGSAAVAAPPRPSDLDRWRRTVYDSYDYGTRSGHLKRLIMERHFGMNGHRPAPYQDVADKAGVSKGRVSQLVAEIQGDLDDARRLDVLG